MGIFADGAAVRTVGKETFRICSGLVDEMVTVRTRVQCHALWLQTCTLLGHFGATCCHILHSSVQLLHEPNTSKLSADCDIKREREKGRETRGCCLLAACLLPACCLLAVCLLSACSRFYADVYVISVTVSIHHTRSTPMRSAPPSSMDSTIPGASWSQLARSQSLAW